MRYLFVHQSFPAQYIHLLRYLAQQKKHEIVYITTHVKKEISGVRCILYTSPVLPAVSVHPMIREVDHALRRAEAVAQIARSLKSLNFIPDIIIGHHGWGELLNISDVFPTVPILGYFEFYYSIKGQDVGFDPEFPMSDKSPFLVRCKNIINLQAVMLPGMGQTPTHFQKNTYPECAQKNIKLLREGVNLDVCRPNPILQQKVLTIGKLKIQPYEKLVTYVARDLEPYRGFHSFMRALPRILAERPDARIVLVGGDGVSYGQYTSTGKTWRETMLEELKGRLDLKRIHFVGWQPYNKFIEILQRSDTHVHLTYPFVLSWSLREAMAIACPLVASDTAPVREFLIDKKNARLVSFFASDRIAECVLEFLENKELAQKMGQQAYRDAHRWFDLNIYLNHYEKLIDNTICRHPSS